MKLNLTFIKKKKIKLDSETMMSRVLNYLKDFDYNIVKLTQCVIIFNNNDRINPSRRSEYYTRVNQGKFEVIADLDSSILILSYKIDVALEFVFTTSLFCLGVFYNHAAFILYATFTLNLGYKIYNIYYHILDNFSES